MPKHKHYTLTKMKKHNITPLTTVSQRSDYTAIMQIFMQKSRSIQSGSYIYSIIFVIVFKNLLIFLLLLLSFIVVLLYRILRTI